VVELLRKRRHSVVSEPTRVKAASTAAPMQFEQATLDSPVRAHDIEYVSDTEEEVEDDAPAPKRASLSANHATSEMRFSGFDSFNGVGVLDSAAGGSGSQPMFDVSDASLTQVLVSDGSQDTDEFGADETPASNSSSRTPYTSAEASEAFPPQVPSPSPSSQGDLSSAEDEFRTSMAEAEEHVHRYADRAFLGDWNMLMASPQGFGAGKPCVPSASTSAALNLVPMELAAAGFTAYANQTGTPEFTMPPALSPAVRKSYGSPSFAQHMVPFAATSPDFGHFTGTGAAPNNGSFHVRSPALDGFAMESSSSSEMLSPPSLSLAASLSPHPFSLQQHPLLGLSPLPSW
jgi:hypothetical protein